MAGIADDANGFDVFFGDNVDFTGGFPPSAKVLLDGQLLIGSSVAPHIRVNTLTAGSNVTITNSNGNIVIASTGGGGGGGLNSLMGNVGSATQVAGVISLLASAVAATGIPIQTVASGSTMTIQAQTTIANGTSVAANRGIASFNSAQFTVDANGFVSTSGTGVGNTITGNSGGALNPTAGNWNILGASTSAGTTPVTTVGSGSTLTIDVQKSQAIASTNATNVGLAAFNSAQFTVDANGFVSTSGTGVGNTITGNSGGALSPTAGNWNILGASTASGTTPVTTVGSGSTLTVDVQKTQAIASTNATNVGLAAFNSAQFTVDANGFVSTSGTGVGNTITGNSGGALSPTAGNWNILGASTAAGTTPVTTSGTGSTLTVDVQKSQAIASTNANNVGLAAFNSADFSVDANGFVTLISSAFAWIDEATSFNAVAGNGYFVTATATATLPATPGQGNTIAFAIDSASGILTITANTGQKIKIGTALSASAGTAASNFSGDSVTLVFRASDSTWIATSVIGTFTVT